MPKSVDIREDGRIWYSGRWRTPEQIERRKELDRKKNQCPEYKRKSRERNKKYYERNREEVNRKQRKYYHENKEAINKRKTEWGRRNREHKNRMQREHYARNRVEQLAKILASRKKRDPTIGLYSSIQRARKGEIEFSEVVRRFSKAISELSGEPHEE